MPWWGILLIALGSIPVLLAGFYLGFALVVGGLMKLAIGLFGSFGGSRD